MKTRIIATIIALLQWVQLIAQNVKRPDTYYYNRGVECLREGKEADAYDYFLLLGQSVLGRLGKIEIDNEKRVIKVTGK